MCSTMGNNRENYKHISLLYSGRHAWTIAHCAKVGDGPVEHVDVAEKVKDYQMKR